MRMMRIIALALRSYHMWRAWNSVYHIVCALWKLANISSDFLYYCFDGKKQTWHSPSATFPKSHIVRYVLHIPSSPRHRSDSKLCFLPPVSPPQYPSPTLSLPRTNIVQLQVNLEQKLYPFFLRWVTRGERQELGGNSAQANSGGSHPHLQAGPTFKNVPNALL